MAAIRPYVRRLVYVKLVRTKDVLAYYLKGLSRELQRKGGVLLAQAIAFKVLISIVPLIILATGVLGQVLNFERITTFVNEFLPAYLSPQAGSDISQQIFDFLSQLERNSNALTLIGGIGLVFSGMTLFTTLREAVSRLFQEEWHESRSILRGYLFDVRMGLQVGLTFLLTFGLSLAVQALNAAGVEAIEQIGLEAVWVRSGWGLLTWGLGLLIPFLLTMAMFFQIYYFIPQPYPPKRSALLGTLFAAVLWELTKRAFTFYATHVGTFERYRGDPADSGIAALGDAFGLIIAFVFWVYFSGLALILGALVVMLNEKRRRFRREKQKDAGSVPEGSSPHTADAENEPAHAGPPS